MAKQSSFEFQCMRCGKKTLLDGKPPRCPYCGHGSGVVTELVDTTDAGRPKDTDDGKARH